MHGVCQRLRRRRSRRRPRLDEKLEVKEAELKASEVWSEGDDLIRIHFVTSEEVRSRAAAREPVNTHADQEALAGQTACGGLPVVLEMAAVAVRHEIAGAVVGEVMVPVRRCQNNACRPDLRLRILDL